MSRPLRVEMAGGWYHVISRGHRAPGDFPGRRGSGGFPVGARAEALLVRQRLELLRKYPWSSYRAYGGYAAGPEGLATAEMLGCFAGRTRAQRRKAFRDYTEEAIREGWEADGLLEQVRHGVLLGSEEWVERTRDLLQGNEREQPALGGLRRAAVGWEEVPRRGRGGIWRRLGGVTGPAGASRAVAGDGVVPPVDRTEFAGNWPVLWWAGLRGGGPGASPDGKKTGHPSIAGENRRPPDGKTAKCQMLRPDLKI